MCTSTLVWLVSGACSVCSSGSSVCSVFWSGIIPIFGLVADPEPRLGVRSALFAPKRVGRFLGRDSVEYVRVRNCRAKAAGSNSESDDDISRVLERIIPDDSGTFDSLCYRIACYSSRFGILYIKTVNWLTSCTALEKLVFVFCFENLYLG